MSELRIRWAENPPHNGGILQTKEFGPNQLRPLVTIALPAYQIQLATGRDVNTAKDLECLKISTTCGTLAGLIFSPQSSVSNDFRKIVKTGTE